MIRKKSGSLPSISSCKRRKERLIHSAGIFLVSSAVIVVFDTLFFLRNHVIILFNL